MNIKYQFYILFISLFIISSCGIFEKEEFNPLQLNYLQSIIDSNECLSGIQPLELGKQSWTDGNLEELIINSDQFELNPNNLSSYGSPLSDSIVSLIDSLPENIGDLEGIGGLYINGTSIKNIPQTIGDISSLRLLELNDNKIDTIPDNLWNLTLYRLDLRNNKIYSLSDKMSNLTLIGYDYSWNGGGLLLDNNFLTSLPESISEIKHIMSLSVRNNDLLSLPELIGDMIYLNHLDVSYNCLTELPQSISNIDELTTLNISNNNISYYQSNQIDFICSLPQSFEINVSCNGFPDSLECSNFDNSDDWNNFNCESSNCGN
tara:strand:- start:99 stop:1055 length:957 start_codon:yes stop_codon:yes gene_type:complete